jgi:hypothetical protein
MRDRQAIQNSLQMIQDVFVAWWRNLNHLNVADLPLATGWALVRVEGPGPHFFHEGVNRHAEGSGSTEKYLLIC